MTITLWIDTASSGCNLAITQENEVLAAQFSAMTKGQAEALLPMLDICLHQAKIVLDDISMIIVTKGPGSFTGVRIGLACAKALALCLNIPLKTITNFDLLYYAYRDDYDLSNHCCILSLNSFRFEPFIQRVLYGKSFEPQIANMQMLQEQKEQYILLGDTELDFWQDPNFSYFKQYDIKETCLLQQLFKQKDYVNNLSLQDDHQAFYIRDADVSISQKKHKTISKGLL